MLAGMASESTMFDRAGGEEFFEALTLRFYDSVAADPVLRPLYPEDPRDFEASRQHLKLFLMQYWGGPSIYRSTRGAPQLRARHARFAIGPTERDAWVRHMTAAVKASGLKPLDESQMLSYLSAAASHLVNTPAEPVEDS
jgi:hemoglobin